jgi:UDP-glucose 4-epimerase
MGKKILVTGGAGYIGSHTVVELLNKGEEVLIVDNFCNSHPRSIRNIKKITGKKVDIVQLNLTERSTFHHLNKYDIKGVIHFAALKSVNESVTTPIAYYQNNLESLTNILSFVKEKGIQNFIYSSSCTVYGIPDKNPVTEETPIQKCESPYGTTKAFGEQIIQDFHKQNPINITVLRYFNPIGAHDSGLIGDDAGNKPPANLLPYVAQVASGKRRRLYIFGDDYNTPDGTCLRDYIHVVDLANAHIMALNSGISGLSFYNVGTGKPVSVTQLVNTFEKVNGYTIPYAIVKRREGDIPEMYADNTKIKKELGWKPKYTLEDMVKSSFKFQRYLNTL